VIILLCAHLRQLQRLCNTELPALQKPKKRFKPRAPKAKKAKAVALDGPAAGDEGGGEGGGGVQGCMDRGGEKEAEGRGTGEERERHQQEEGLGTNEGGDERGEEEEEEEEEEEGVFSFVLPLRLVSHTI
jgi:hypothetical protein